MTHGTRLALKPTLAHGTGAGPRLRDGLIATNPAQVNGASTAPHPERKPMEVSEVAALAEAVAPPFRAAALVAACSGLRPGELVALTCADVAADAVAVSVFRTLMELPSKPVTTGPLKSSGGRGTVALPSSVAVALVEHLEPATPARSPSLWCSPRPEAGRSTALHGPDPSPGLGRPLAVRT